MRNIWLFLIIIFVFVYFISPFDFIPDFFGLFGRIDDFALFGWLIWFVRKQLRKKRAANPGSYRQESSNDFNYQNTHDKNEEYYYNEKTKTAGENEKDPYVILNVSRYATKDEIKKTYKELIKKYHPDKVAYLGEDFQKIAHKKMIKIQKAYETLMG